MRPPFRSSVLLLFRASSHRRRFQLAVLSAVLALPLACAQAAGPPIRSTHFDGTAAAAVTYASQSKFDSTVAMTIEAWVYRENAARCETILSHYLPASYWFGFCPKPRFYRGPGFVADSTAVVPAHQWTH